MEQHTNGSNDPTRLDRIERIMEVVANTVADLQQDVKIVLKSQVIMGEQMTDGFTKLTARMDQLAAAQVRTEESLRHTDQRMDALILTVDEIIRGRKQL